MNLELLLINKHTDFKLTMFTFNTCLSFKPFKPHFTSPNTPSVHVVTLRMLQAIATHEVTILAVFITIAFLTKNQIKTRITTPYNTYVIPTKNVVINNKT